MNPIKNPSKSTKTSWEMASAYEDPILLESMSVSAIYKFTGSYLQSWLRFNTEIYRNKLFTQSMHARNFQKCHLKKHTLKMDRAKI